MFQFIVSEPTERKNAEHKNRIPSIAPVAPGAIEGSVLYFSCIA